jgi:hypothetical protein
VHFARFARECEGRYWEEMYLDHVKKKEEKEKVVAASR